MVQAGPGEVKLKVFQAETRPPRSGWAGTNQGPRAPDRGHRVRFEPINGREERTFGSVPRRKAGETPARRRFPDRAGQSLRCGAPNLDYFRCLSAVDENVGRLHAFIPHDPNDTMQIDADLGSPVTEIRNPAKLVGLVESVRLFSGERSAADIRRDASLP